MAGRKKTEQSFESGLEALEKLVREMEEGGLSLEDSLEAYERGMKLYQSLLGQLQAAKARVEKLRVPVAPGETPTMESFEVPDGE